MLLLIVGIIYIFIAIVFQGFAINAFSAPEYLPVSTEYVHDIVIFITTPGIVLLALNFIHIESVKQLLKVVFTIIIVAVPIQLILFFNSHKLISDESSSNIKRIVAFNSIEKMADESSKDIPYPWSMRDSTHYKLFQIFNPFMYSQAEDVNSRLKSSESIVYNREATGFLYFNEAGIRDYLENFDEVFFEPIHRFYETMMSYEAASGMTPRELTTLYQRAAGLTAYYFVQDKYKQLRNKPIHEVGKYMYTKYSRIYDNTDTYYFHKAFKNILNKLENELLGNRVIPVSSLNLKRIAATGRGNPFSFKLSIFNEKYRSILNDGVTLASVTNEIFDKDLNKEIQLQKRLESIYRWALKDNNIPDEMARLLFSFGSFQGFFIHTRNHQRTDREFFSNTDFLIDFSSGYGLKNYYYNDKDHFNNDLLERLIDVREDKFSEIPPKEIANKVINRMAVIIFLTILIIAHIFFIIFVLLYSFLSHPKKYIYAVSLTIILGPILLAPYVSQQERNFFTSYVKESTDVSITRQVTTRWFIKATSFLQFFNAGFSELLYYRFLESMRNDFSKDDGYALEKFVLQEKLESWEK